MVALEKLSHFNTLYRALRQEGASHFFEMQRVSKKWLAPLVLVVEDSADSETFTRFDTNNP